MLEEAEGEGADAIIDVCVPVQVNVQQSQLLLPDRSAKVGSALCWGGVMCVMCISLCVSSCVCVSYVCVCVCVCVNA